MANEKPGVADDKPDSSSLHNTVQHRAERAPVGQSVSPSDAINFDTEVTVVREHSVVTPRGRGGVSSRLELIRGPGAPRVIVLCGGETVIGRSIQATVCLDSHLLSRRHVAFVHQGYGYRLQDLESSNGVYLNGVKVHSAVLHEGDVIQIGDVLIVFHEGSG